MGTRHLIKVIDTLGELRVAQYGQWDGYPSGQGIDILQFVSTRNFVDSFKPCLDKCFFVGELAVAELVTPYGDNWTAFYPQFSRDTCSDILKVVYYSSGTVPLVDNSDFENDELFCEAVYTLDFESNKFISKYGSSIVEFAFDSLPTQEEYLNSFS